MGLVNLSILVERIKKKLESSGFIKNTDYASSSTGGVIKVDSTYATEITSGGKLKAKAITAEAYSEANDASFISKATLDNVLASQPAPATGVSLTEIFTGSYTSGTQSFTYPTGKSLSDYSVMGFVGKVGTDDFSCFWIPTAVFASAEYAVGIKIGTFSNDEGTERKLKIQVNKDGSGLLSGVSTGSATLVKVYVF